MPRWQQRIVVDHDGTGRRDSAVVADEHVVTVASEQLVVAHAAVKAVVAATADEDRTDALFHALADRTRRDILRRVLVGEHSVSALAAPLVSAPHHGSRHSSSAVFVKAVRPRWVIVQAGYRNRFGHPDPGVVARYRQVGARVARTDHAGAIQWRWRSDGAVEVEAWRLQHARYWHNRPAPVQEPESIAADEPVEGAPHPDEALQPY